MDAVRLNVAYRQDGTHHVHRKRYHEDGFSGIILSNDNYKMETSVDLRSRRHGRMNETGVLLTLSTCQTLRIMGPIIMDCFSGLVVH